MDFNKVKEAVAKAWAAVPAPNWFKVVFVAIIILGLASSIAKAETTNTISGKWDQTLYSGEDLICWNATEEYGLRWDNFFAQFNLDTESGGHLLASGPDEIDGVPGVFVTVANAESFEEATYYAVGFFTYHGTHGEDGTVCVAALAKTVVDPASDEAEDSCFRVGDYSSATAFLNEEYAGFEFVPGSVERDSEKWSFVAKNADGDEKGFEANLIDGRVSVDSIVCEVEISGEAL